MRFSAFYLSAHRKLIAWVAALTLLPGAAQALTVQYSHSVNEAWDDTGPTVTSPGTPGALHTLPLFDPALGTLQSARLDYSYSIQSFVDYNRIYPSGTGINPYLDDDPFTPGPQQHIGIGFAYSPNLDYLSRRESGGVFGPIAPCILSGGLICTTSASTTDSFAGSVDLASGDLASLIGVGTFFADLEISIGEVEVIDLVPLFQTDGTFQGYANAVPGSGSPVPAIFAINTVIGGYDVGTVTVTYEYTAASTAIAAPPAAFLLLIGAAGIAITRRKRP